jgi:hypothetical protein
MDTPQPNQQQIQINADQKMLVGAYANMMRVLHTKEEFVLEFANVHPPVGEMVAKVITTPGHMKRILAALSENVSKYEASFGKIEEASAPAGNNDIGFKG